MDDVDGLALSGENRLTEAERVRGWRLKVCLDLGYSIDVAESLTVSDADLHELEHLIRAGCPLDVAARIV